MQSVKQSQPFKTSGHTALLPWEAKPSKMFSIEEDS